jgi:hypothetical protein
VHPDAVTYSDRFGFLLLERGAEDGRWTVVVDDRAGREMTRCELSPDGRLACRDRFRLP